MVRSGCAVKHFGDDGVDREDAPPDEILLHVVDAFAHTGEVVAFAEAILAILTIHADDDFVDFGFATADAVIAGAIESHHANIGNFHGDWV